MTREEAITLIKNDMRLHHDYLSSNYRKALNMAIEALQAEAEGRCHIRIYADDEPSVKAEKLYQICGETQDREVAKWLKEYFLSDEDRENYELATEQMEHDAMYEPTYNPEDGRM